jgi:carboxypeptidase D
MPYDSRSSQNTTFGGIQGFTVPPNTTWYDDNGEFAGVIRQERNWTFAILYGAGHQTPVVRPELTQSLLRQFWIGNSSTLSNVGLVEIDATTGATKVHTAVVPSGSVVTPTMLPDGVMPGQTDILIHDNKVVTRWPQATRAVWSAHVASVLAMHTNSA